MPDVFSPTAPPQSRAASHTRWPAARGRSLVKGSICRYLESFFTSNGANRSLVDALMPNISSLIADRSFDPETDKTKRVLLLQRWFKDMRENLPAIIVADTGFNPRIDLQGIDRLQRKTVSEDGLRVLRWYPVLMSVPLTLTVGSLDSDTTGQLADALSFIFNTLRQLSCGSLLRGVSREDTKWEVRLPGVSTLAGTSTTTIADDSTAQLFMTTVEIEPDFEALTVISRARAATFEEAPGAARGGEDLREIYPPQIVCPSTIALSESTRFVMRRMRVEHKLIIDDYRIAVVDPTLCVLYPRRLGSFKLQVYDKKQQAVVLSQDITVTI